MARKQPPSRYPSAKDGNFARNQPMMVRVNERVRAAIEAGAARNNRTVSAQINLALMEWCERQES
jgi:hypothetical protein